MRHISAVSAKILRSDLSGGRRKPEKKMMRWIRRSKNHIFDSQVGKKQQSMNKCQSFIRQTIETNIEIALQQKITVRNEHKNAATRQRIEKTNIMLRNVSG